MGRVTGITDKGFLLDNAPMPAIAPAVFRPSHTVAMQGFAVIATSPALSRPVSTVTDGHGLYKLSGLPPGTYRLVFRGPAIPEVQRDGIQVRPRRTTPLFVHLRIPESIAPP
ncbi:MAG: Carboxypeptidase regulatory-like domain [Deltaproteobacteria bacterium]|nr:Carboxypeptidase regulatory-like domain [Deltaproteobacteria bacterium]